MMLICLLEWQILKDVVISRVCNIWWFACLLSTPFLSLLCFVLHCRRASSFRLHYPYTNVNCLSSSWVWQRNEVVGDYRLGRRNSQVISSLSFSLGYWLWPRNTVSLALLLPDNPASWFWGHLLPVSLHQCHTQCKAMEGWVQAIRGYIVWRKFKSHVETNCQSIFFIIIMCCNSRQCRWHKILLTPRLPHPMYPPWSPLWYATSSVLRVIGAASCY